MAPVFPRASVGVRFTGSAYRSYGRIIKTDGEWVWIEFDDGHVQDFLAAHVEFDNIIDALGALACE